MRTLLSTSAFLLCLGFSVTQGFETNLATVKSFENPKANALLQTKELTKRLHRQALPYGQSKNKYQEALKRKAKLGAKWLNNLNEENPLDSEERNFFRHETKKLVNPQSYDSEFDSKKNDKSRWSEYIIEKKEVKENDEFDS